MEKVSPFWKVPYGDEVDGGLLLSSGSRSHLEQVISHLVLIFPVNNLDFHVYFQF